MMSQSFTTAHPAVTLRRRLLSCSYEILLLASVLLSTQFLLAFTLYLSRGSLSSDPTTAPSWLGLMNSGLTFFIVPWFYFCSCWTKSGQTLALKTWRLQLLTQQGERLSWPIATRRFATAWLGSACFGITYIWALIDPEKQFLHDRLCKTRLRLVPPSCAS